MVESLILPSVDGYRSQRIDRHRRRCGGGDQPEDSIALTISMNRSIGSSRCRASTARSRFSVMYSWTTTLRNPGSNSSVAIKPLIAAETPDGLAVLLEPVAASRGELAGDVLVDRINKQ